MDYILKMKEKNISFNMIDENTAIKIMQQEYSYYQLMEYSVLFDQYIRTNKQGKFVNLDFSQIYYLALIDEQLRHLIMQQCLEFEKILKVQIIDYFKDKSEVSSQLLNKYITQDNEYLLDTYKETKYDILQQKYVNLQISELNLEQFLDVIQFGTLERFWIFCCDNCSLYSSTKINTLKECFLSTRYLRNASAHNNSILSNLSIKVECSSNYASTNIVRDYLRESGINQKTLSTNMSKKVVRNICNFMFLCNETEPLNVIKQNCECWNIFFSKIHTNYADIFRHNETLKSAFTFLQNVNIIFLDELIKK